MILSLDPIRRKAADPKSKLMQSPVQPNPILQMMRAYWEGLREDGALPQRAALDPRGIEGALSQSFLIERIASGLARFRIAGMDLTDLMGMDVRGMPLSSCFEPTARQDLATALEQVFASPAILTLDLEAPRSLGRPVLQSKMLVLPLQNARGEVVQALGCLVTEGAIGRSPRRFTILRHNLSAVEHVIATSAPPAQPAPAVGFAEPTTPFPARPKGASRPYLRLVKTDD
jgi:hypothetical protein